MKLLPSLFGRIYFCAQLALCRVWQLNWNCCDRCLGELPGSALRSTYMLYRGHSASETVTSGSREGARNHRGNKINYQVYFSSAWLPMAWHINCSCSCIFWMVNFHIKWHGKMILKFLIYGNNSVDTISYYCLHEEPPQLASNSERDCRAN